MAHLSTTVAKQSCCHIPGHALLLIRRPLKSFALTSRLQAQNQRCRCSKSAGSNTVTAQQSSSGSAQLARQPQQPAVVLSRNQLANKQVVTRTDGQILGVVDHLLANSNTFRVDALSCKLSPDMLAGDEPKQIGLMSLKQISDVLLVHDSRALLQPAETRTINLGYVKLVGTVVKTAEGKVIGKVLPLFTIPSYEMQLKAGHCYTCAALTSSSLLSNCTACNMARSQHPDLLHLMDKLKLPLDGLPKSCTSVVQVRDFLFSPDDGRISELIIDALGIPAVPERLLGCLGVRIQLVNSISFNCVSLRPGAEVYVSKISPGAFDGAVELLKVHCTSPALILFSCLFSCHCDMPSVF